MTCSNDLFIDGKLCKIEVFLGCNSGTRPTSGYELLGYRKGLSISTSIATSDITTDETGGYSRTAAGHWSATIDFGGQYKKGDSDGVALVEDYINNPANSGMTNGYSVWLKVTRPITGGGGENRQVDYYPAVIDSWESDAADDARVTYSGTAKTDGQPYREKVTV